MENTTARITSNAPMPIRTNGMILVVSPVFTVFTEEELLPDALLFVLLPELEELCFELPELLLPVLLPVLTEEELLLLLLLLLLPVEEPELFPVVLFPEELLLPYPLSAISPPTSGLLPAIPKGLKESVENTIVLPYTSGTIVSIDPSGRICWIVYS